MANALLDFVMSLVRDPDAAARYAADPSRALAEANLTDVTSADVQNLIPVVSESLSMAVPMHTWDALTPDPVSNVWASGAATAAVDAFDDQLPERAVIEADPEVPEIVDDVDPGFEALTGADLLDAVPSLQVEDPVIDGVPGTDAGLIDDWAPPVTHQEPGDHAQGFDLFD
ncbi:MAG: Rv0340 family IniB-related protein [Dietzia sp.]|nr:Rv0340 family IniB-related protein [Dietzia sp.]